MGLIPGLSPVLYFLWGNGSFGFFTFSLPYPLISFKKIFIYIKKKLRQFKENYEVANMLHILGVLRKKLQNFSKGHKKDLSKHS